MANSRTGSSRSILRTLAFAGLLGICAGVMAASSSTDAKVEKDPRGERVARGRYLVTIGSCNDCHTPWKFNQEFQVPEPDMSRMLSGHPAGAPDPASEYQGHDMAIIGPTFTSFRFPFGGAFGAIELCILGFHLPSCRCRSRFHGTWGRRRRRNGAPLSGERLVGGFSEPEPVLGLICHGRSYRHVNGLPLITERRLDLAVLNCSGGFLAGSG